MKIDGSGRATPPSSLCTPTNMHSNMPSRRRLVLRIEKLKEKHYWTEQRLSYQKQRYQDYQAETEQYQQGLKYMRNGYRIRKY